MLTKTGVHEPEADQNKDKQGLVLTKSDESEQFAKPKLYC